MYVFFLCHLSPTTKKPTLIIKVLFFLLYTTSADTAPRGNNAENNTLIVFKSSKYSTSFLLYILSKDAEGQKWEPPPEEKCSSLLSRVQ